MMLSNDLAALIGFGCEATAWGAYAILFLSSMYLLAKRKRGQRDINMPITGASILLFLVCTTHYALEFNHFYVTLNATGVPNFANETTQLMGADLLISVADFLGDVILIYRCWLIWGKNWYIIILPSLTAAGGLSCLAGSIHLLITLDPTAPVAPPALLPLATAGYSLPLATNIIVTALIVLRIWHLSPSSNRELRGLPAPSSNGRQAIDIVIESGLLYTITQLIFVILFTIEHPAQAIVAVVAVQVYGIAPTLIIIRVALGLAATPTQKFNGSTGVSWGAPSTAVRIGYSTTAFTDGTNVPTGDMDMPDLKGTHHDNHSGFSKSSGAV